MTGRGARPVLLVASLGGFLAFLDVTIVNVAFPAIEHDFDEASRSGLSWVLNAYNVAFAATLLPAGQLADRVGSARAFAAGLLAFTAASAACAAAPSAEALVAARIVQAVGAGVMIPASLALVLAEFPPERRASAVALYGAAAGLASGLGPSLGGVLVEASSWRWVFLVNVPIGAAALIAATRILPAARPEPSRARPDVTGAALLALAASLLALAIVQGERWGWGGARVLGAAVAGAALLALALRRARRHPAPALPLDLLGVRAVAAANAGTLLFATAFYAAILCNVLFVTSVWGYSLLEAGLAVTPSPLTGAILAGPAGKLAERIGPRPVIGAGLALFALGLAWYRFEVGTEPAFAAEWLPGALLYGAGVGLAFPTFGVAAVAGLPARRYATGSALNSVARQFGAVLGVAVLVAVVGTPGPADAAAAFDEGWTLCLAVAALAAAAAVALGSSPRGAASHVAPGAR